MEEKASEQTTNEQAEILESLAQEVVAQIQAGDPKNLIIQRLTERGIDEADAKQFVEEISAQLAEVSKQEEYTSDKLLPAILGGLIAALLGSAIWATIVVMTETEFGIVAWGIGILTGYAVMLAAGRKKGLPLQIIAVAFSLIGIFIGKYAVYYYFMKEFLTEAYGSSYAARYSFFSSDIIAGFFADASYVFSLYDLLWIGLAVVTAWRITKAVKSAAI
ncbi:hypothetical protein SAMN05421736_11239 [Evansella caseinilytica]|uniref:Uncharacterized protein n=1 Tax=Evansella caseinilytica TaxID=1503961 RepID=A0A1H3SUV2_9BACI|nr:hypothetical protein [Evansella caseinilytica]SDZ41487.1 hypothetical protein SAMN05421736_11239 [Evansella caseinilytica]